MNLLITDDQPNVLAQMASAIDWRSIGIDRVFTASSALLAKDILRREQVDILLTDIEMPIEDGLSLVRWIKERNMKTVCILITAHTDFIYAKQAISLGVMEYIVQPARSEDILRAVRNAMEEKKRNLSLENALNLSRFSFDEQNEAAEKFLLSWPKTDNLNFTELLQKKLDRMKGLNVEASPDSPAFLIAARIDEWNTVPMTAREFTGRYSELQREVFSYIRGRFLICSKSEALYISVLITDSYDEHMESYLSILSDRIRGKLECSVSLLYQSTSVRNLRASLDYMLSLEELESTSSPSVILCLDREPDTAKPVSGIAAEYYGSICRYIDDNIEKSITRSDIAAAVHLSPDYISHIVRQTDGISFKELIAGKKMARARELLLRTELPVGDIAARLGFDSFAYFSKVYRQYYRETPRYTRKNRQTAVT